MGVMKFPKNISISEVKILYSSFVNWEGSVRYFFPIYFHPKKVLYNILECYCFNGLDQRISLWSSEKKNVSSNVKGYGFEIWIVMEFRNLTFIFL